MVLQWFDSKGGRFQSGQMGQTVNLLSFDFGGSNPPLPTALNYAGVAQLIEHQPSKLRVEGLSPFSRSRKEGVSLSRDTLFLF